MSRPDLQARPSRVRVTREGVVLGDATLPVYSGTVHYFHMSPDAWRPALASLRHMGARLVDTYVPWGVHEVGQGEFDFGERDPHLEVERFLRIAGEEGLYAIVRPGPHINGELTYFGLPERIVWDPACQARSPEGHPVVLPMLPTSFPVPSYASERLFEEVDVWYAALARRLSPLRYPEGPIVLCQVDNEAGLYFRDGLYDQDYRPENLAGFREYLREKYGPDAPAPPPPTRFEAHSVKDLALHLDWGEFQELVIARALARMAKLWRAHGMDGIPIDHNLPMGHEAGPFSVAKVSGVVDLVGLDYYNAADELGRTRIERRTTEIVAIAEERGSLAFAAEMGVGFPPFFAPRSHADDRFTLLTALAYGLRGANLYMAADRDRWIGAPIDERGALRPEAAFFRAVFDALERVGFRSLRVRAPVRLVVPASHRRLVRALHLGLIPPMMSAALGGAGADSCAVPAFGLGAAAPAEVEGFLGGVARSLARAGVSALWVEGSAEHLPVGDARWLVCAPELLGSGGLEARMRASIAEGVVCTRPEDIPFRDDDALDGYVLSQVDALGLERCPTRTPDVFAVVHEDAGRKAKVVFLIHQGEGSATARLSLPGSRLTDVVGGGSFAKVDGEFRVEVPRGSVRLLAID